MVSVDLIDFVMTHLRVLALTLPWITAESGELTNSDGDKKKFTTHATLFFANSIAEQNEWSLGHQDNFDSKHLEIGLIIAFLVVSLLISVFVYFRGKLILGDAIYTTLHLVMWILDLAVVGVFYDNVEEELERLNYDTISFGLFAIIACLLVSTFHVARFTGKRTGLYTFCNTAGKY